MEEHGDNALFGVEIVKFGYEHLPPELSSVNWEEKFAYQNFDASEVINSFSDYFFTKSKDRNVDMQVLLLTGKGCVQMMPSNMESQLEKTAFTQILPQIISEICEEDDDHPVMLMMCCEAWTCALSRQYARKIEGFCSQGNASEVKAKVLDEVVQKWGGISAIPNNHSQVIRFDGYVHISFFNDATGPVSVMRKKLCDEKIGEKIDPAFMKSIDKAMVARGNDIQGNLIPSIEGFMTIGFDEANLA